MEYRKKGSHKRRSSEQGFIGKIKNFFRRISLSGSPPKEYRPYLGPEATEEDIKAKTYENTRIPDLIEKRMKKERKRRLLNILKLFNPNRISEILEKRKHERRKRKFKRKIKRGARKEIRKENRIAFIRRFFPQYKKSKFADIEFEPAESPHELGKTRIFSNLTYFANSTMLFIIAYLLVYMLYQFKVLFFAAGWRLDSVLFYYDLAFNDFSPLWNRTNIIVVTLSGPLISLLLGLLVLRFLAGKHTLGKYTRLFFLWIGIHGVNLFLGAFATGVSFDEGFGYVAAWLYMNMFWKILLSLIFLFLLGVVGYYSASKFLETSYSLSRIRKENSFKFLLYQAFLPWLIGSALIMLVKIPNNLPYETGNLITLVFAITPLLFNIKAKPSRNYVSEKMPNRIKWFAMVLVVVMMLLFRLGLNSGLHIKLFYRISFSLDIIPL